MKFRNISVRLAKFRVVIWTWHVPKKILGCHQLKCDVSCLRLDVPTHQECPVKSASQRRSRGCLAYLQRPHAAMCTHKHSRVLSRPTSPAESTVLMQNVSFSAVGFQWSGVTVGILHWGMHIERLNLLFKENQAIYNASHCDYRNISSRSGHKWLNIPNSSLFTFTRWTRIFRLLWPNLRLHINACETSRLKFPITVGLFTCALFKNTTNWFRAGVSRLNFI